MQAHIQVRIDKTLCDKIDELRKPTTSRTKAINEAIATYLESLRK